MSTREEAYEKSVALLHELVTPSGFLATTEDVENYERVWSRDGIVAGIASLLIGDAALIETFKQTLATLEDHQDETGRIPSNVVPKTGATSYGTTVGRIDATLWYVIGVVAIATQSGDRAFFDEHRASVESAIFYLDCLELNGKGLLYIPQGGDWADEYINHGYVLFDEMLYYFALSAYTTLTGDKKTAAKHNKLRELIRINYFPTVEHKDNALVYHKALYGYAIRDYTPPLPAAYFTNHSIRFHVDAFAIGLLLLSDIVSEKEKECMQATIQTNCCHDSFPIIPAFHPVITQKDHEWEHLRLNFLYEFRNTPNHYHNGGLWPLVHGFFLASFPKENGLGELDAFAEVLARDNYIFPEYYHGETFEALGTRPLGFSASAYLIAYESIVNGKTPFVFPAV